MKDNRRTAYKRPISPRQCRERGCNGRADYEAVGAHGTYYGDYCREHIDAKLKSLDAYYEAMRLALTGIAGTTEGER